MNQAIEYGLNTPAKSAHRQRLRRKQFQLPHPRHQRGPAVAESISTQLNLDSYNTERLDFARGPNAILFGEASPAGLINTLDQVRPAESGPHQRPAARSRATMNAGWRSMRTARSARISRFAPTSSGRTPMAIGSSNTTRRRASRSPEPGGRSPRPRSGSRARQSTSTRIARARGQPTTRSRLGKRPASWEPAARRNGATGNVTNVTRLLGANGMIVSNEGVLGGVPIYMNANAPLTTANPNQFRVSLGPTNIPGLNQPPQVMDFSRHPARRQPLRRRRAVRLGRSGGWHLHRAADWREPHDRTRRRRRIREAPLVESDRVRRHHRALRRECLPAHL